MLILRLFETQQVNIGEIQLKLSMFLEIIIHILTASLAVYVIFALTHVSHHWMVLFLYQILEHMIATIAHLGSPLCLFNFQAEITPVRAFCRTIQLIHFFTMRACWVEEKRSFDFDHFFTVKALFHFYPPFEKAINHLLIILPIPWHKWRIEPDCLHELMLAYRLLTENLLRSNFSFEFNNFVREGKNFFAWFDF